MNIEQIAKKEINSVLKAAKEKGSVTQDGIWVRDELAKLGWMSEEEIKHRRPANVSELVYACGYGGNKNQANMHKALS